MKNSSCIKTKQSVENLKMIILRRVPAHKSSFRINFCGYIELSLYRTNIQYLSYLSLFLQVSVCWNCGRPALETCSGCNLAKYCSRFCQHKDWDSHHKVWARVGKWAITGHSKEYEPIKGTKKNSQTRKSRMTN